MKNVIIVGATSGIGHELAKIFANENFNVGITGRRTTELEKLMSSNPDRYWISSFDCTLDNNSNKLADLVSEMGGLDLLVLSSGRGTINKSLDFDIEDRTNKLNVIAFTEIMDWAFNYFQKQGHGQLASISSIAGIRGSRLAPAYNASKAYQISYLQGLRQKAKKSGKPIFVTDIRPGFVDTDMAQGPGLFWVASKEKAARQIYSKIINKKEVGYITKRWALVALVLRILPNWMYNKM